jgi:hypothetical protein
MRRSPGQRFSRTPSSTNGQNLDGQTQVDLAMQSSGWELEKAEVEMLLELARETEAVGTDAKAEALLELIYKLQQEEGDPGAEGARLHRIRADTGDARRLLESRGFSVATLNGSMDLEARTAAQTGISPRMCAS